MASIPNINSATAEELARVLEPAAVALVLSKREHRPFTNHDDFNGRMATVVLFPRGGGEPDPTTWLQQPIDDFSFSGEVLSLCSRHTPFHD